ncbi:hypothetical protein HYDPIDRAFT_77892 [Hydnomerulius pinastri MD-312]|nr:hypothetical protein HYDPIDRAFT_77892 [Hydnomerulius pinastri MD-312]
MAEHGEEYLAVLKASYDYEPQSEDEIAIKENQIVFLLEKTDDDWWKVKIKGESQDEDSPLGLVPAAYVEQAEHTSVVKALYDYDAAAPGELTIKEDEVLMVFDREDDWILVQSQKDGGKAGFIPGNYVEESTGEEEPQPTPAAPPPAPRPQIIVPPSPEPPARPVSVYVDPADRVAQAPVKAQADNIKTWAVSEVDKKGKKKKGTLGIGNGSLFFASESDKTPVQKWDTADVQDFTIEKHKHVLIDMGGANPMKLHFNVGKEEIAETILTKLDDSHKIAVAAAKAAAAGAGADLDGHRSALTPSPRHAEAGSPSKKNGGSVRFAEESPEIIPPRSPSVDGGDGGEEEEASAAQDDEEEGEPAVALYDFEGTGSDELSVQEGERLHIVEKEGDEWWKCRNAHGVEGVVPASYLEVSWSTWWCGKWLNFYSPEEDDSAAREEEERQKAERKERQRQARERVEKERKKAEQERAKAAEAERKRREKEEAAAAAEAQRKQRQEAAKRAQQKAEREQSSGPPPESTRIWHDRSGQFRVEAALLGFSGGKLRLHKINGVVIEVPSEKMSVEDIRYVERLTKKKAPAAPPAPVPPAAPAPAPRRVSNDDDDQPLALKQAAKRSMTAPPPKKGPTTDWFEFFLSAGCDIDDCTRYAHSFERDKIDESILPDITESTMRSLGLREGDIIRVNKVIQQKFAKPKAQDHIASDEELARRLQEEENGKKATSPAPNLFAGPGGLLKNNTTRRGRPQPSKSLPPPAVDLDTIGSASDQIKRTGSPLVRTSSPAAASPVQPPQRSSSALTTFSGFDDDAWTNRPGSAKPAAAAPTPPPAAPRAPSAPPAPQPAAPAAPAQPQEAKTTGTTLAKTDADIFDQLARLTQLRTNNPATSPAPASAPPAASPPVVVSPPIGYNNGLGMGSSPAPLAQHLQNQQTGVLPPPQQNGPRGPFAPVPANQSLLQPLIPTQTGFNNFVPTRPNNVSPFQSQPTAAQPSFLQTQPQVTQPSFLQTQPQVTQPSFLQSQPTGFPGNLQPLISQPTGFPGSGPMMAQPTGIPGGTFGNFTPTPSFANTNMAPVQTNPTGFSPFGQSPFNNVVSTPSPAPSLAFSQSSNNSTGSNTSPANIFAQMKSGTFASGNEHGGPQQPEKYDALRPQPTGWAPPNGWGFQNPNGGFQQSGYTGY